MPNRRVSRLWATALVALLAALAASAPGTWAASPLVWSSPRPIDVGGSLTAVSCPSRELCVAVDKSGRAVVSIDPAAASPLWTGASIDFGTAIASVSCASPSLCVAVDAAGHALTSAHPSGGASAWTRTTIDESASHELRALTGVSCPTSSLCVAVDAAGNALVTTTPTTGGWKALDIAGSAALHGVSCASASLCVAVDGAGEAIASSQPTTGASAWRARAIDAALTLEAVSCASSGLCVAVDAAGNVLASVDPTDAAPTWSGTPVDAAGALASVACIAAAGCVAVDGSGEGLFSEAPSAVPPSWTAGTPDPGARLTGVSCVSDGFCVAVDASGRGLTTTLPLPPPPPPPPPVALVYPHPTISGVPAVNSRLLCDAGVPSDAPATLTFAWMRDGSPISGASSPNYRVGKADARHHLQCLVTATNAAGSVTAHSGFVAVPAQGIVAAADETVVGHARLHGAKLEVPVKCSSRAARVCVIAVRVTAVETLRHGRVVAVFARRAKSVSGARRVTVLLGSLRVRLAPGQARTLTVSLSASGRRLLAKRRRLPAQLLVAGTVIGVIEATLARQVVAFKR
jgi:hypothetical protein